VFDVEVVDPSDTTVVVVEGVEELVVVVGATVVEAAIPGTSTDVDA
jgi:hypothetical protein